MKKLNHVLLTTKHTEVWHETAFTNNAPNYFDVVTSGGDPSDAVSLTEVRFQEGPIREVGVNGVTNEDLIAMVICRLEYFQKSEFSSRDNEMVIIKLEEALLWLRKRTIGRETRNVEGTHTV